MKTFLLIALLYSGSGLTQTNVIAAKSHASSKTIDLTDTDNFGEPGPMRHIEKVRYLKDDCIVEKYKVTWSDHDTEYDTICDHPFLKKGTIDLDRLKAMYPIETEFVGFEKLNNDEGRVTHKEKREKRSRKSNAFWLMIIGGGMLLFYAFVPKFNLKSSDY